MKKTTVAAILSSILLFSGNLYAESTSLSNQNIQGSWTLEYTKKSEKSEETVKREDTWIFNDNGTVTITHIPREGGYYDQAPVNYKIEDGDLKISILGRSGKFDNFSLVNKEEKIMTLKARFGDIYQFIKK
ncbi:MAG: lipocalin family protein [Methylococcales bacterium]|nr:lipocalin family protein [Methylococcales bacterium]